MKTWANRSWRSVRRCRSPVLATSSQSRLLPTTYKTQPCDRLPFRTQQLDTSLTATSQRPGCRWVSTQPLSDDVRAVDAFIETLQPPSSNLKNVEAWLALIEPYLPSDLRSSGIDPALHERPLSVIASVIIRARQLVNIDILAYLGITLKRWRVVHWICSGLVQEAGEPQHTNDKLSELMSNIPWGANTASNIPEQWYQMNMIMQEVRRSQHETGSQLTQPLGSIDKMIDNFLVPAATDSKVVGTAILGEIWITLGNLILAAAGYNAQASTEILPNVLRIIATLHHYGWIPEAVYHDSHNIDPSALQQPPLLSELSSLMITALSEAAYQGEEGGTESKSSTSFFRSMFPSRTPDKIPNLGPEIWMEFCLWCCVHGGWVQQGSAILDEMRKAQPPLNWSLIYWRDILEAPEEKWEAFTQKRLELQHGRSTDTLSRRDLVQRTISAEVVIAIIEGLVSDMMLIDPGVSRNQVLGRLVQLQKILRRDDMSLGVSSWDAVIARIADTSTIDIEARPTVMENILNLTETYGQEIRTRNAPKVDDGADPVASYVFDASAAVIGLYHRTLHAYIKARDVPKSLRVLKKLQSLTDVNKMRSVEEFFRRLQETPVDPIGDDALKRQEQYKKLFPSENSAAPVYRKVLTSGRDVLSSFPGVQYPGYFPAIPTTILADLLELLVNSNRYDAARWMLFSQDIDGPLISESMYGDQSIAPALIKYAASTNDTKLLVKVTQAQNTDISGPTLIALCQSRIRQRNFAGAVEVLNVIRDYSIHEWKPEESATILHVLLLMIFESSDSNFDKPVQLMQRMLRGNFGKQWGDRPSQLDTVVGVLSDFSPAVQHICAGLLRSGDYHRVDMSTKTFNILLGAAVRSLGATTGQRLVQNWCYNIDNSRHVPIIQDAQGISLAKTSPAARFFGTESEQSEIDTAIFEGTVAPNVETIRVIIDSVLRDQAQVKHTNDPAPSEDASRIEIQSADTTTRIVPPLDDGIASESRIVEETGVPDIRQDVAQAEAESASDGSTETAPASRDDVTPEHATTQQDGIPRADRDPAQVESQPAEESPQAIDLSSDLEDIPFDDSDRPPISFDRQHPIMEWAITILREDFNMNSIDIDYITQGYLTSQHFDMTLDQQDQQVYSSETIRMWNTLQATRKLWARTQERRLRALATNPDDRQLVISNVPSVERYFLHCLAADFGLETVEYDEEGRNEKDVKFTKRRSKLSIPMRTIGELLRMQKGRNVNM